MIISVSLWFNSVESSSKQLNERPIVSRVVTIKGGVLPGADGFSPKFNMEQEYQKFIKEMDRCSQERFNKLCTNQQTGKIDEKSIVETRGGLQANVQKFTQINE